MLTIGWSLHRTLLTCVGEPLYLFLRESSNALTVYQFPGDTHIQELLGGAAYQVCATENKH